MPLLPPSKQQLDALAAGDRPAYAALYDRLGARLLRVAVTMLGSAQDAEDAVQELFLILVRSRHRFPAVEDLDAYVFACLRNAIAARIDRARRERSHLRQVALHVANSREPIESAEEDLAAALEALPDDQREVVTLKVDGGLTFGQIGNVLRISPNTAASRYRYALEKLRQRLGERL